MSNRSKFLDYLNELLNYKRLGYDIFYVDETAICSKVKKTYGLVSKNNFFYQFYKQSDYDGTDRISLISCMSESEVFCLKFVKGGVT